MAAGLRNKPPITQQNTINFLIMSLAQLIAQAGKA
jgi:hypothetical protein